MFRYVTGNEDELFERLNGALITPRGILASEVPDLDGETLIFAMPDVTVTFATPATLEDMRSQVETQLRAGDPQLRVELHKFMRLRETDRWGFRIWPGLLPGVELLFTGTASARFTPKAISSYQLDSTSIVMGDTSASGAPYFIASGKGVGHYKSDHSALAVQDQIYEGAASLTDAIVSNGTGGSLFFQLHDRDAAMTNEVPAYSLPLIDGETLSINPTHAWKFMTGLRYGFSTTQNIFTAAANAGSVYANYRI